MKESFPNHYEQAFQNWLIDNRIEHLALNKQKTIEKRHSGIKSFDFLLKLNNGRKIIAEVKGRKFKGTSFEKMTSMECWVTADDIEGLTKWSEILSLDHEAIFVFTYKIDNIDVDFDGQEVFEFDLNRYVFLCIRLDDYRKFMIQRSPKWHTVTLPANKFRQCEIQLSELLK